MVQRRSHLARVTATIAASALAIAVPVLAPSTLTVTAQAAGGTGTYADWTYSAGAGSMAMTGVSATANFTTNGSSVSVPSGSTAWLSAGTPFGSAYGSSQNRPYLSIGVPSATAKATTTYTFTTPPPAGSWGFALGDIDADYITITATAANGQALDVSGWYRGVFNYCGASGTKPSTCSGEAGTDLPTWNAQTATLTGSGSDTKGASGWFQPTAQVKTLTFEFGALMGFPNYQTWFASDTAPPGTGYYLTVAARTCPDYPDIMANRGRNNVMQSLEDLGVNSIYTAGQPVNPATETLPATGQAACTPLTGWTVGLGSSIGSKDTGTYGSLSRVNGLNGTVTTAAQTPELDSLGNPTGRTLAGAATIELTAAQLDLAIAKGSLVLQGGVPGSPLNNRANTAFGVVRCAIDNFNGDNVEFVKYPSGSRHVFCYAYYVDTAPAAGQITVTKVVEGPAGSTDFRFGGDVSYDPGGTFSVRGGQSKSFIRQAGVPWTITELANSPYELANISCNGTTVNVSVPTATAVVTLAPNENVTCTFTNRLPPTSNLDVYKVSSGSTGSFTGQVTGPSGYTAAWSATTTKEGEPVLASTANGLVAGTYTLSETVPTGWTASFSCADAQGSVIATGSGSSVAVAIPAGTDVACVVSNQRPPEGSVTVRSTIVGGSGAASVESSYVIQDITTGASPLSLPLTNTAWSTPVSGGTGSVLPLNTFEVIGIPPASTDSESWVVQSVSCTGSSTVSGTTAQVTLTGGSPTATCDYVYRLAGASPELDITKSVVEGDDLRAEPVVLAVSCTTSGASFTTTVVLPVNETTVNDRITLPADATACSVVETETGISSDPVEPGEITVTWNGTEWAEDITRELATGDSAVVEATSSTDAPVTTLVEGPCMEVQGVITAMERDAECVITAESIGTGDVEVATSWSVGSDTGEGTSTSTFDVASGETTFVTFENSYTGEAPTTVTERVIETQSNPGILTVTKTVTQGDDLRTGDVVIEVTCTASAAADPDAWPQVRRLRPGRDSRTWQISVPGDERNTDECRVTETSSGASGASAGRIVPTWNGEAWRPRPVRSLGVGQVARVAATASTGNPVSAATSEDCRLTSGKLRARVAGSTCVVTFTAAGVPGVSVETRYPEGRTVATSPETEHTLSVTNAYAQGPRTITATRSVRTTTVAACPLEVDTASSVAINGTTVVLRGATTGSGCEITRVVVRCAPVALGGQGDVHPCTVTRLSGNRVAVTTNGQRGFEVQVRVVARGAGLEPSVFRATIPTS